MVAARHGPVCRLLATCACVLLAVGCPVEGKRKQRVNRDALSGSPLPAAKACECPESLVDGAAEAASRKEIASGKPRDGGVIRIQVEVEPASLLPVLKPDAWVYRIVQHDVLEALVVRDHRTGKFRGELAETWEVSDDGLTWEFTLRDGVTWHDGKPFGIRDVIHTLDIVMSPDSTAVSVKASLEEIEKYEARGEDVLVLHLSRPNALFLQHLEGLSILPRHLYVQGGLNDHPNNRAPVGTGPFRFGSWTSGKRIVLERNDDYWGETAHLDEVHYVIVKDRAVALQMLERGDIDLMPRAGADQWAAWDDDEDLQEEFHRLTWATPDFSFIMYDTKSHLFSSPETRRAMTMLLDRERIRCAVHRCLARVVTGPWPYGHPANSPDVEAWPFDPDEADRLLEKQGWKDRDGDGVRDRDGRPFAFTFIIPTQSDSIQRLGTIYQEELEKHGIDMQIKLLDWTTYVERCRSHEFDMAAMSFQMEWDNDLTGIFHSKSIDGGQNFVSWKHPGADYILERAREELDATERNLLLRDLHEILHQEQPYTFCFATVEVSFLRRGFHDALPSLKWYQEREIWKE